LFHVDDPSTPVCFAGKDPKIISDSLKSAAKSYSSSALNMCFYVFFYYMKWDLLFENCGLFKTVFGTGKSGIICFIL